MRKSLLANKALGLLVLSLLTVGCLPIKPGSTGFGGADIHTFYMEGGRTQYFVPEVQFKKSHGLRCEMDFTLRSDFTADSVVTVNVSFFSDQQLAALEALSIGESKAEAQSVDIVKRLFIDVRQKGYETRYTGTLSFSAFAEVVEKQELWVFAQFSNGLTAFEGKKKTDKLLRKLNEQVLKEIELNQP